MRVNAAMDALHDSALENNTNDHLRHGLKNNSLGRERRNENLMAAVSLKNPARISPRISNLFARGTVGAELHEPGDASLLFYEEARYLTNAMPTRAREFAAGRLCARRALERFGFTRYPLRVSSDRSPQWPSALIGSITHAHGVCAAVVAQRRFFRGIGLDMEIVDGVTRETWPVICTPPEAAALAALPSAQQARYAALVFSAKESFYKCQYNVTRQWLEFHDVSLDIIFEDSHTGYFVPTPRKKINALGLDATTWMGRFQFYRNVVLTGIAFKA